MTEDIPANLWTDEQKWTYLVRHERLGELLVRLGKISLGQLETCLSEQEKSAADKHLGEIIVEKKILTLDEIVFALEKQKQAGVTSEHSIKQLLEKKKEQNRAE